MRHRPLLVTVIVLSLAVSALSALMILGWTNISTFTQQNCRSIETLKTTIRHAVAQSTRTLGQPGSAGYGYYHSHPSELLAARRAADAELALFRPRDCN